MANRDLIVHDEFINGSSNSCTQYAQALEEILTEYISILKSTREYALISGGIADVFSSYIETAMLLQGALTKNSERFSYDIRSYLTAIDKADDYLF